MNVGLKGIKASELMDRLQKMVARHGDCRVYSGGTDYPEGVQGVGYREKGDAYVPPNSFVV